MASDRRIELLEYDCESNLIDSLHKATTGEYFIPLQASQFETFDNSINSLQLFLSNRADYPAPTDEGIIRVGIVDSGLLLHHPLIEPFLESSKDFTGDGESDVIGHGTMVALVLIVGFAERHDLLQRLRLVNIKVIPDNKEAKESALISAIDWCRSAKLSSVNLSVGTYNKKFGLFPCNGTCPLCLAAERLAGSGVKVFAAAGNIAGETSCPAKVGLLKPDCGVICVGANDFKESGKAAVYQPSRQIVIKWPQ